LHINYKELIDNSTDFSIKKMKNKCSVWKCLQAIAICSLLWAIFSGVVTSGALLAHYYSPPTGQWCDGTPILEGIALNEALPFFFFMWIGVPVLLLLSLPILGIGGLIVVTTRTDRR
jgi:hypothetical protein